jgi:thiol-disulfide isomerase/thioredoxin
VRDIDLQGWGELLKDAGKSPIVLIASADWCGPCHLLAAALHEHCVSLGNSVLFLSADFEKEPEFEERVGKVNGFPTIFILRGAELKDTISGELTTERRVGLILSAVRAMQEDRPREAKPKMAFINIGGAGEIGGSGGFVAGVGVRKTFARLFGGSLRFDVEAAGSLVLRGGDQGGTSLVFEPKVSAVLNPGDHRSGWFVETSAGLPIGLLVPEDADRVAASLGLGIGRAWEGDLTSVEQEFGPLREVGVYGVTDFFPSGEKDWRVYLGVRWQFGKR